MYFEVVSIRSILLNILFKSHIPFFALFCQLLKEINFFSLLSIFFSLGQFLLHAFLGHVISHIQILNDFFME